jgi:hypothetical protein
MNDDKSFTDSCCRIVDAARNPVNRKVEGLLFCGECRDVMAPVIRNGRSVRIVGLFCLNCMERVQVRRGRLLQAAIELSAAPVTGGAA